MDFKLVPAKALAALWFAAVCSTNSMAQAADHSMAPAAPSNQTCEARVNDTSEKLLACIQQKALWQDLSEFQKIADQNPGTDGHGNRDTGTAGYKASIAYVAGRMKQAGYRVTIQTYRVKTSEITGVPQFSSGGRSYTAMRDWYVARLSGGGIVTATLQTAGSGCSPDDFRGFVAGKFALLQRGACSVDTQMTNAQSAGASAVVLYHLPDPQMEPEPSGGALRVRLTRPATVPVIGIASALGSELAQRSSAVPAPTLHLEIHTQPKSVVDYNLIADSPFGDQNHIVVVEGHVDSIFGAGILDNASGSATILEIALKMAKTQTRNQLRYIWFGGEELGLLGSDYYTRHLSTVERQQIAFDLDADVTATPNFDYMVADPAFASNVKQFPPNVVPQSRLGNKLFADFFRSVGVPSRPAGFGNDGTDSNSFSLIGIPNTGILTRQDCCKQKWEVKIWGGVRGNYEGKIPSFDGGCVDNPGLWCDNLSNNDPIVLELASKATAYVVFKLANHSF